MKGFSIKTEIQEFDTFEQLLKKLESVLMTLCYAVSIHLINILLHLT